MKKEEIEQQIFELKGELEKLEKLDVQEDANEFYANLPGRLKVIEDAINTELPTRLDAIENAINAHSEYIKKFSEILKTLKETSKKKK